MNKKYYQECAGKYGWIPYKRKTDQKAGILEQHGTMGA